MKKRKISKPKIKIITAKSAGFCFGVRRAIDLAEQIPVKKNGIFTLGPIIHNPQEVQRLEKIGIKSVADPFSVKKGTIVLRTHGIPAGIREKLVAKELNLVDATCPFVKRAQDVVNKQAKDKCSIVIVGEKTHPEVVALVSYGNGKCHVLERREDIKKHRFEKDVRVVSQTTQTLENFNEIIEELEKKGYKVKAFNTICRATIDRQNAASRLAKKTDIMIVIGGKNSGNTRRLAEICGHFAKTYHIEIADEIKPLWLKNVKTVGLTAGASTPDWIIQKVKDKINSIV